ncbi:MAG: hypothetical protein RL757_2356 [Bacteroidota bacterium]|jgi:hypothetical protein
MNKITFFFENALFFFKNRQLYWGGAFLTIKKAAQRIARLTLNTFKP